MNPVAFSVFGYDIKWYSLLILFGIIFGWIASSNEARKFNIKSDFILNLLFWVIIVGIIGARLYYVGFNLDYYSSHIGEIFKVWEGGLAIHGGLIAGSIMLIIYCKRYRTSVLKILDILAPYVLFAQGLGRWGNFFNQEAYGIQTTYAALKSIKIIPEFVINGMHINGTYFTPTFYYEFLWCMIGFVIIEIVRHLKYTKDGYQISIYLMWYSLGRFFIESLRTDSLMLSNIKIAQIISIILFVIGFILMLLQIRKPKLDSLYKSKEKNGQNFF